MGQLARICLFLAVFIFSAPSAFADIDLDLNGYFRSYAVYADNRPIPGADEALHKLGLLRDAEIHFTGKTVTDSGLNVGVHGELILGSEASPSVGGSNVTPYQVLPIACCLPVPRNYSTLDKAYIYFSGGWGRINLGSEDGAAYLLQVAAPSADSNIDGLRVNIQTFASQEWKGFGTTAIAGTGFQSGDVLGYDNANFRSAEKLTYLTPKWNGFQAGVSYIPTPFQTAVDGAFHSPSFSDVPGSFQDIWEAAGRWDGNLKDVAISAGAGYSQGTATQKRLSGNGMGSDNLKTLDLGLNAKWQEFSIGSAFKGTNTGGCDCGGSASPNIYTTVLGGAWDEGPYHLGMSAAQFIYGAAAFNGGPVRVTTGGVHLDRLTFGGGYEYEPGMSFRGSVAGLAIRNSNSPLAPHRQFQIAIGTDINF